MCNSENGNYRKESEIPGYPGPEELWQLVFTESNAWRDRLAAVPFEDRGGYFQGRYYQDLADRNILADGKERTIQHMLATSFWHPDGTPMSAQQFIEALFGKLPEFFKDKEAFRNQQQAVA